MNLSCYTRDLHPRHAFRISRGTRLKTTNVFVEIEQEGFTGYGEASPNSYYAEDAQTVQQIILRAGKYLAETQIHTPADIAEVWERLWPKLAPSRAAQCAIDLALWDLLGKRSQVSVCRLALGADPAPVISCCTLGLAEPEELEMKLKEVAAFPLIKVKMNQETGLALLHSIREATSARLCIDANGAWTVATFQKLLEGLEEFDPAFIEQPLPPEMDDFMPDLLGRTSTCFLADESCVREEDVERMPGRFSGFNIKLVKCGGLTPALRMLRRGRELGLKIMVGCMLESSLLISAGAVIAQQTDYADLDGSWLLSDDPFTGAVLEKGMLSISSRPGLGAIPQTDCG